MTMYEVSSAVDIASAQLDDPVSLHPVNVSKSGDDTAGGKTELIRDLQGLSSQSAGGLSGLRQVQTL